MVRVLTMIPIRNSNSILLFPFLLIVQNFPLAVIQQLTRPLTILALLLRFFFRRNRRFSSTGNASTLDPVYPPFP